MSRSQRRYMPAVVALALLLCAAALPASAAPLFGDEVTIREPDGSTVTLRVWGDEFYAVGETVDGYTVTRDESSGLLCYARLSGDGRSLVSTGVPATRPDPPAGLEKHIRVSRDAARARALAVRADMARRAHEGPLAPPLRDGTRPTTGEVLGIVLLVDFSDDPATIPTGDVDDFCNLVGYSANGNNGSVRDYFYEVSDEALDYTNYVPTYYHRASKTKAYYTDPSAPYGERARELIVEALTAMDDAGFDFVPYANGDGVIDAVNCFYAGGIWNNWAEGLWPHSWTVNWSADGVSTGHYQITDMGSALTLSTFCHENGHMLMNWPDLYDYDGDSSGVGRFCIMCNAGSSTNPVEPCAYLKARANWADVRILSASQSGVAVPADTNVVYKARRPGHSNEYFLIENRQEVDRDVAMPDNGLAIWHVDTNGSNDWNQMSPQFHYLVTLVQADGDWDLENGNNQGDSWDLYAAPTYSSCGPETYPHTDWWDGSESGHAFTNISTSGMTMTFDYGDTPPPAPTGLAATPGELSVSLEWDASPAADFDRFIVERDTCDSFGVGTFSDTIPENAYLDGPLSSDTEYFYRVRAVDLGDNVGDPSGVVSANPLADMAPATPADLAALGGSGVIELRWSEGPEVDIAGYHVLRDSLFEFSDPETLGFPSAPPFVDSDVALHQSRWYRIVAEDVSGHLSGQSPRSACVAVSGDGYYVDASNTGPAYGTFEQPYPTISEAMGDAAENDIVIVYPGVYPEAVLIEQGVSLVGMRGADSTSVTQTMSAYGLSSDVVLKGLTFDGGGSLTRGLNCQNSRLRIEDCVFRDVAGEAVSFHTGGAPLVLRSSFLSNQRAISCSDSAAPVIVSSVFDGSAFAHVFSSGAPGPVLGGSLSAANDFTGHGMYAVWNSGASEFAAELNYWGDDCVDPAWFYGPVDYAPWTDAMHTYTFTECWADVPDAPAVAYAEPSYPNPLNPSTTIAFGMPSPGGRVSLRVYDVNGRLVRTIVDGFLPGGRHHARWDGKDERGRNVASGVYFYSLEAPGLSKRGKSVVVR
ncbi:MAG: M6 family metalloprotease domain-containing protein [Candidatus Eisenbacteria bacterium]|nr:M6 family metalloprotease domain-containing protein [Candidatus Eisenbacteria bacterium]